VGVATVPVVAISEADKTAYLDGIGYFSGSEGITLPDGTYIQAISLNDERQKGWSHYLICVETRSAVPALENRSEKIEVDLRQVLLHLDSGKKITPDSFVVRDYRCPGRGSSTPRDFEALLREPFRPATDANVGLGSGPGTQWLQTLVLSFNQPPLVADERFTLQLGALMKGGRALPVPIMKYSKCHLRLGCDDPRRKDASAL